MSECSSYDGVTEGLIDGLIATFRVLASRDLSGVQEALADLRETSEVAGLLVQSGGWLYDEPVEEPKSDAEAEADAFVSEHFGAIERALDEGARALRQQTWRRAKDSIKELREWIDSGEVMDETLEDIDALRSERDALRTFVQRIAEAGLRADLQPTVMLAVPSYIDRSYTSREVADAYRRGHSAAYGWWTQYVGNADSSLRNSAMRALEAGK